MKQKKLVLTVVNSEGNEIIEKDPASLEHVQSSLMLYDEVGTKFELEICEVEINQGGQSS